MKNLQKVDIKVYSDEDCERSYESTNRKYHICAGVLEGGKGACDVSCTNKKHCIF